MGWDGPNMPKACFRGMIGFDREIDAYTCMAEVETFLKNSKL